MKALLLCITQLSNRVATKPALLGWFVFPSSLSPFLSMPDFLFQLPLHEAEQFITGCVHRALEALGLPPPGQAKAVSPKTAPPPAGPLLRISDVCRILDISKPTCAKRRNEGALKFYRLGRFIYFREEEVMAALKEPKHLKS